MIEVTFIDAMRAAGLEPHNELVLMDGQLQRFRVRGDKPGSRNGWAIFHRHPVPAGAFGSWRTGESHTFRTPAPVGESRRQQAERRRQIEDRHRQQLAEQARVQASARERLAKLLAVARPATDAHPYLLARGVHAYGILQLKDMLMIPARDTDGVAHTAQFIGPDGAKRFLTGGRIQGCYFAIGRPADTIYLAEGYSTAATVFEATGAAVAACFSCGNLKSVALALRAKFPESKTGIRFPWAGCRGILGRRHGLGELPLHLGFAFFGGQVVVVGVGHQRSPPKSGTATSAPAAAAASKAWRTPGLPGVPASLSAAITRRSSGILPRSGSPFGAQSASRPQGLSATGGRRTPLSVSDAGRATVPRRRGPGQR